MRFSLPPPLKPGTVFETSQLGDPLCRIERADPPAFLRWSDSEAISGDIILDTDKLIKLAQLQRIHLAQIALTGISVPSYSSFIAPDPYERTRPALFNVVGDIGPNHRQFSPQQLSLIGNGLMSYLKWVRESDQPYFLDDIYRPTQFSCNQDRELWLLDIEPNFSQPNSVSLGSRRGQTMLDQAQLHTILKFGSLI